MCRIRRSAIKPTITWDHQAYRRRSEALAALARELGALGYTPATSGNYSCRLNEQAIAVTRSGVHKRHLSADDMMVVDLQGQALSTGKPSAETLLHCQLYRLDPSIGAVLHVHTPAVTVISRLCASAGEVRLEGYELLKALTGQTTHDTHISLRILPNDQDMPRLAGQIEPLWPEIQAAWAYLIAGHGIYVWGHDLDQAARHLEAINFMLDCELLTYQSQRND
ncbi:MAG: methylthioribulose 1-phosphate dehydratase [Wenzhouxiangellaceae bacterium]